MLKIDTLQLVCIALSLAMAITVAVLLHKNAKFKATIEAQKLSLSIYEDAQQTNLDTITRQKSALEHWVEACAADEAAIEASIMALEFNNNLLEEALKRARDEREVIYVKSPETRQWSERGMPAAVADQLFPQPRRPH